MAAMVCLIICWPAGASPSKPVGQGPPDWTDTGCGDCHRFEALFSHPVDVIATMPVPRRFPLADGRLTCVTCHREKAEDHREARRRKGALLRGRPGARFCAECHERAGPRSRMHAAAGLRAHSPPAAKFASLRAGSASSRCLICHDGTIGRDIDLHGVPGIGGLARSHPVDVAYRAGPRLRGRRAGGLRPLALLDRRIRLRNDRVGCVSCHSLYSKQRDLLVMTNRGSRLCAACHAMQ